MLDALLAARFEPLEQVDLKKVPLKIVLILALVSAKKKWVRCMLFQYTSAYISLSLQPLEGLHAHSIRGLST